ncbi:MAG: Mut7-C RNAse domain-containing protein [Propionivibrio sp.]
MGVVRISVELRFYAELADFLPCALRGHSFEHAVATHETVKHIIEALGVPHTEVGLLLVNGETASMDRRLEVNDRVAVFPALRRLAPLCGVEPRFAADSHLGRLARYLRFCGFDTLWDNAWDDADLVAVATGEARVVLTRDRALLMHRALSQGCYLRDTAPLAQLADVGARYALELGSGKPARCLECNERLDRAPKQDVAGRLLPGTLAGFDEFWHCGRCDGVFWRGSHWRRMREAVDGVARAIGNGLG